MWEDFHRHRHEPVTDEQKVIIQQPRIHFGSDHIDVLYAILIEVKAPYDEYDRLSLLTQKQKSRPEGFLMVLTYAKQWLLADCLEGVTSTSGDSDDDEDEFEDAITPPTLSLAARLEIGMNIILVSREYTSSNPNRKWWRFVVGKTIASIKQSCVEDEINVYLDSLSLQEMRDAQVLYHILLSEDSTMDHFPYLEFSCVIPAYQSRLVGHQPSTELHMRRGVHFKLKDETLVTWMALLAPMWTWWNQWNLTHPSKQLLQQLPSSSLESFRVAPIAKRSIEIKCIHIQYFIHDDLSFGIQLEGIQVTTVEDEEQVVSSYSMNKFRIFSVEKATASTHRSNFRHHSSNNKASTLRRATGNAVDGTNESTEAVHEILVAERLVLRESSHSRTKWSQAAYECQHQRNDDYDDVPSEQPTMSLVRDTSCSISYPDGMLVAEIPMYAYEVLLPSINVSLHVEEIESLCWVIGKWSYYLVESTDDDQSSANPTEPVNSIELELDSLASGSRRKDFCRLRWTVAIPDIIVNLSQQDYNTSSDIELPKLCLILEELNIQSHECSRHRSHRITASSVRLQESKLKVFTIPYASSGPAITLSHSHRTKLFRNTTNARNGGFYLSSNDELNVTMERSLSLLSTDFIHILLGWTDTWSLHYDVGMMFSSSWGYDLDTLKRNVMRIKEPVENFPGVSLASKKAVQSKKRRNFQLNVFMPKGLMLTILHTDPVLKRPESEIFVVECTYGSISSLSRGSHRKMKESSTRGTLHMLESECYGWLSKCGGFFVLLEHKCCWKTNENISCFAIATGICLYRLFTQGVQAVTALSCRSFFSCFIGLYRYKNDSGNRQ
jgi:hypothetical protein